MSQRRPGIASGICRLLALGALALPACGGSSGSPADGGPSPGSGDISTQPLAGKIGGQPWTFAAAETNAFLSTDDRFWVDVAAVAFTPCTDSVPFETNRLILNVPKAPGTYNLSLDLNQTFVVYADPIQNDIAISGKLVVESVTSTTIKGAAKFSFKTTDSVDGTFEATICP